MYIGPAGLSEGQLLLKTRLNAVFYDQGCVGVKAQHREKVYQKFGELMACAEIKGKTERGRHQKRSVWRGGGGRENGGREKKIRGQKNLLTMEERKRCK